MNINWFSRLVLAAGAFGASCSNATDRNPDVTWTIFDNSDNIRGSRSIGALTLADGENRASHPSLQLGCSDKSKPELYLLFDLAKSPKDETAVGLSFLKHRMTVSYPITLWKSDAIGRLIYSGDLTGFAKDFDESFTVEVSVTSEKGKEVFAYSPTGFRQALQYMYSNCIYQKN